MKIPLLFGHALALVFATAVYADNASTPAAAPVVDLKVGASLPAPALSETASGEVTLLPGLFRDRRELTKAYVLRLKAENLLLNYQLEAGVPIDRPIEQMHQGWESPSGQLRGHFTGHWLSAAAHFGATDHDPVAAARAVEIVQGLKKCQELNGGLWVGSIPEKYFSILEAGKVWVWSPQYTLHKTMMGLFDAYHYGKDKEALTVLEHSAEWFSKWTQMLIQNNHADVAYTGESPGMLELWTDLYSVTHDPRHLELASRYAMPELFRDLLTGKDALTHNHANASIPWIQGAARVYEITGDTRYRQIVETFWKQAVETRGMFATTGNNAGEFWIPPQQFGRFLGKRTQEHCTVYNMIRVAQYLYRWTGEARYADYIERALYNGVLAQQNPTTGMVSYFLPTQPGSKKQWGSETKDFWCCHGSMIQAQAMFEDLIYHNTPDGVTVSQFIPSKADLQANHHPVHIAQTIEASAAKADYGRTDDLTHFVVDLVVTSEDATPWTLRVRQPAWAADKADVTVDGKTVAVVVSKNGFLEIRRDWTSAHVTISFPKRLVKEPLPGDGQRFALLDGPIVLAALADTEPEMAATAQTTPLYERVYQPGRDWQAGHYLLRNGHSTVVLEPLYEVVDENYCIYLSAPH